MEDLQTLIKSNFLSTRIIKLDYLASSVSDLSLSPIYHVSVLHAMRDDSDKVPALLTDYILKGRPFSKFVFAMRTSLFTFV